MAEQGQEVVSLESEKDEVVGKAPMSDMAYPGRRAARRWYSKRTPSMPCRSQSMSTCRTKSANIK
eukprot:357811-Chlamydomonas_euryale.AAC.4